jgi:hypothetical protein
LFQKTLTALNPTPDIAQNNNDRRDDDAKIKKKVIKMVHEIKNRKTKLPQFRFIIDFGVILAGLTVVIGLLYACDAAFSTVLGVYLGYKALRLVMRLFGLFLSFVFTLFSLFILVLIITLLIF